jgi:hypothetical protein
MTPTFERGDRVKTPDGTLATFVRLVDPYTAIIGIGPDSRLVDPVTLRRVEG